MPAERYDLHNLCRLDGFSPTARERWLAFYRLWRIVQRAVKAARVTWLEVEIEQSAAEDFRVLMNNWRWIQLLERDGDELLTAKIMPRFLRWERLQRHRRERAAR